MKQLRSPREMEDEIDSITAYLVLGLIVVLLLVLALLGLEVVIGFLATISIGG